MKLAFTTLACPRWTLAQIIDAAQRYGYEGLEMRLLDGKVLQPDLPAETRRQVIKACHQADLPIACLDTSVKLAQPDPAERQAQIRDGLGMIELAAAWQSPLLRVFGQPPAGVSEADGDNAAVETLEQLARRGEQLGVTVMLETHDAYAAGSRVAQVINRVPSAFAGALWDTLHPCRMAEQPGETIRLLGKRIRHVHIKDGQHPGDSSDDWKLVPLGEGEVPVPQIMAALKGAGYDGWLSVEWEKHWHPEIEEPEIALPQHAAKLREYLAAL